MSWRGGGSVLPIGSAFLWLAVAACGADSAAPVGPEDPDDADPVVNSISVWPCGCPFMDRFGPERTIGVLGTTVRFSAAALAEDGTILYRSSGDPDRFSWSSSAPDVATVEVTPGSLGGSLVLVTGVSEGTATISATSEGVTGEMTVPVRDHARPAWSLSLDAGSITAGIAIGADGTVYVVNHQYGTTGRLFALSPQGSVVWTLATSFRVVSTPAIGEDGALYLGGRAIGADHPSGRLISVDPGGTVRWVQEDLERIRTSPAIGPDGTIYVAGRHRVYAIDPRGEIQWIFEREHDGTLFFASSPGIASDGTIYLGGEDGLLYAIDPDGSLRWTFRTDDRIRSSPSIGADGTIYVGSHDGRLYAVHPDGTERWRSVELDSRGVSSSPSIGPDGTIYVIAGGVYAIEPHGSIRWSYRAAGGGGVRATPILGTDGTVYLSGTGPSGERVTYALDSQGRLQWDYHTSPTDPTDPPSGHSPGSPAIGVDGTILSTFFSGSSLEVSEGTVLAITETDPTNGGFEGAPWPTERGDRANTGRAGG